MSNMFIQIQEKFADYEREIQRLKNIQADLYKLNSMGADRELKLIAEVERLKSLIDEMNLNASGTIMKQHTELERLQAENKNLRDCVNRFSTTIVNSNEDIKNLELALQTMTNEAERLRLYNAPVQEQAEPKPTKKSGRSRKGTT